MKNVRCLLFGIIFALVLASATWAAQQSLLSAAVERKDAAAVRQLLQEGAIRDEKELALFLAAQNNAADIAGLLIQSGVSPNTVRDGSTALSVAAWFGSEETARILIQHGADVNAVDNRGDTPLHAAAQMNNPEMVGFLLSKRSPKNARGENGQTPLHRAVIAGHRKVVDALLLENADVNARDNNGDTALMMVAGRMYSSLRMQIDKDSGTTFLPSEDRNSDSILPLLIRFDADVNARNRFGDSALHHAAYGGRAENVAALLNAGADPGIQNAAGETPLDNAKKAKQQDIVKMLTDADAAGTSAVWPEPNERNAALLTLLKLATVPMNHQWTYKIGYFDELQWGDREKKVVERRTRLAAMDPVKTTEASADLSKEIAEIIQGLGREREAEPYREKAEAGYRALLKKKPRSASLLYKLGLTLRMAPAGLNKKSEAESTLTSAVKADAAFCPAYTELLADNWSNKKWTSIAKQCFKRSIARTNATAADHFEYHRFNLTRIVYEFVGSRPGTRDESLSGIMSVTEQITSDENISLVKKAVELDPGSVQYRASLASLMTGRIFNAWMRNIARALETDGTMETLLSRTGAMTREKLGDLFGAAEENFIFVDSRAKDIYPMLYAQWAILMMTDGRVDAAEQALRKAIALEPAESGFYEELILLTWQWMPKDSARQKESFDRIAGLLEKKCRTKCTVTERSVIARLRFNQGGYRETVRQLRSALQDEPESLPLRTNLAVVYVKMGRRDLAAPELRAAKAHYLRGATSDQAHFCSFQAVISLLENDEKNASDWVQNALKLDPEDAVATALMKK